MRKEMHISGTTKEIYFVFVTFIAFIFMGISRAYLGFFFPQLDSPESPIHLDNEQKSLIAAFTCLLCPIGCLIIGICMDLIGRKYSLVLIYVPMTISWSLVAFAHCANDATFMLYVAFLIQGISTGMSFCVGNYISEICTTKHRSSLFAILIISYNFGIVLSNFLMYLLPWNIVALTFTGLSIFTLILTFFLPESPTWLYMKGKKDLSVKTLSFIRSKSTSDLENEIRDLEKYCSMKESNIGIKGTLRNCLSAWRQLIILIFLFFCTINTGYALLSVFGIMILDELNLPFVRGRILVIYSILGILACFFTPYFIHKFKRRTVSCASSFSMFLSLLVICIYLTFFEDTDQTYIWIVPACLFVYSIVSNLGVIPLAFILNGELFPNESRGVLSGIHGSIGYLYWSALQKIYPSFLSTFGVMTSLWTFSVCCFVMTLFAIFILPETKDKTLNEVQEEYFKKNKNTFDT